MKRFWIGFGILGAGVLLMLLAISFTPKKQESTPKDAINTWVIRAGSGSNNDPHILVIQDTVTHEQYFVLTNSNGVAMSRRS